MINNLYNQINEVNKTLMLLGEQPINNIPQICSNTPYNLNIDNLSQYQNDLDIARDKVQKLIKLNQKPLFYC